MFPYGSVLVSVPVVYRSARVQKIITFMTSKVFQLVGDSLAAIGQGMKRTWKIPWQEFNSLAGVVIRVQLLKNPQLVSLLSVGISSLVDFTKFDVCCLAAREPRQPKSPL